MRVQLIDPAGDVAPYDHALAAALASRGAEVELITSRFVHGPAAEPEGYSVDPLFHRLATRYAAAAPRRRRALRLAEHVPDMLRLRARAADIRHFQWLPVPALDAWLLPPGRPRLLTLHNVLRAERLERRVLDRMDALVVHTRAGAEALVSAHGVPAARVRTIPHGAFEHLTRQPDEAPLPGELRAVEGPVVLCFGVVRPYKGVDVLLEAFHGVDAELWIVGRPLGESMERLRRLAPPGVRFVSRYVSDRELPAFFRRADLLVLPHRRVDVSGVLFAGLAFGKAMVLSDVGGFRDVAAEHGAGRLVPPEDPEALGAAIRELLADPSARAELGRRARAAAEGPYSWDRIAVQTLELYEELAA
ncbi:MAG: glycosyltransferase family 4 protein [Thermoleophilaceae bacterium]|nr:glycosyltransferase family 4 protein [Thermoleophilaceae bacterium]